MGRSSLHSSEIFLLPLIRNHQSLSSGSMKESRMRDFHSQLKKMDGCTELFWIDGSVCILTFLSHGSLTCSKYNKHWG